MALVRGKTRRALGPGVGLALYALTGGAVAQETGHHGVVARLGANSAEPWVSWKRLSGDWGGLRSSLDQRGFALDASLITDSSVPFAGDARQRETDRMLLDLSLEFDMGGLLDWRETTVFVEGYMQAGRDGSRDVGDVQAFSNIDAEDVTQLAELWVQRRALDGHLRVKVGKLDANSEFAHVDAGLPFLSSSAGFSPTIYLLPTYPDPAVSVNVFAQPWDGWHLGLGVYNAERDGLVSGKRGVTSDFHAAFSIGQVDRRWESGRFAFGAWHHNGELPDFAGGTQDDTGGTFALLEQDLGADTAGFLQWGAADEDVSPFARHMGAGIVVRSLVPDLGDARTGLYLTHVDLSDEPGAGLGDDELAIELFQEIPLTPSLLLKPDLQWIDVSSATTELGAVWVFTLRLEVAL